MSAGGHVVGAVYAKRTGRRVFGSANWKVETRTAGTTAVGLIINAVRPMDTDINGNIYGL